MQNSFREFVLHRDGLPGPDNGLPAPGPGFAWSSPGRPRRLRRTWLDTFDWRLYHAGLTLEQDAAGPGTRLTLTGRDGTVLAAEPAARGLAWPAKIDALPPGPLREQLAPVVGVRALAPVARAVSLVREQRALNSDEKTVARVAVDTMSVSYPAPARPPDRLTVAAVRGYQAQASRLAAALAAAPGIAAATQPALDAALAAAGRRPGDYSGKIGVELAPRMPAAAALATVLTALLDTLEANVPGTIRDLDTEFLHDLRVAVRRSRSALKLAGSVLPAELTGKYRPEFKWLGDLTTPARDLDVFLLEYPAMAASLTAATPQELEPFRDHLTRQRAAAHRQLARGLRSARFRALTGDWRDALGGPAGRPRPSAARLAAGRIALAHQRVLRGGAAITAASPAKALHDLRKRCKELRYLLEIFGSLYDPAVHWKAVKELKGLQDCLGEFQDTQVQHDKIKAFAAEMITARTGPAPALLAMGEIAAGLMARQRRARGEFAGRFRDFASPASQDRIRALTEAA
ncbi:MAG TPA: CHAD domain-containing protein [Streptosporangiaceae bacterium]